MGIEEASWKASDCSERGSRVSPKPLLSKQCPRRLISLILEGRWIRFYCAAKRLGRPNHFLKLIRKKQPALFPIDIRNVLGALAHGKNRFVARHIPKAVISARAGSRLEHSCLSADRFADLHSHMRAILFFGSLATAAVVPSVLAITPLGHGRLVGTATASLDYDSNIFSANPNPAVRPGTTAQVLPKHFSDWILSETGDVRYQREEALTTLDTGAGVVLREFAHNSGQNSADPYIDGRLGYSDSDKTEARGGFSVRRNTTSNSALNARTRSDDSLLDGRVQYLPTEKLGFRVTGDFATSNYLTAGYSDTHGYSVGVDAVDLYSPKLKLLAGIAGGEDWSGGDKASHRSGFGTQDWRYTVGAEGEIAPKVTANSSVGIVQRHFNTAGRSDTSTLYSSSRLTWAETQKRSWTLEGTQDYGVTALDQSVRQLGLFISMTDSLAEKLSLQAALGYERANYSSIKGTGSRTDDGPSARARLTYQLTDSASFDVSTSYRDNRSSSADYFTAQNAQFKRFTLGAGITARF